MEKGKKAKRIKILVTAIITVLVLYLIAVYSNIPFIAKWRTIYIETAMSTMTHQWLATAFIPHNVVDEVVADMVRQQEENMVDSNTVAQEQHATIWLGHPMGLTNEQKAQRKFNELYYEIDKSTLPEDVKYDGLYITQSDTLKTIHGDKVHTLDTINGIVIIHVEGDGYKGLMALVKDPSKVKLAASDRGYTGDFVVNITENSGAILGINASGFYDPNGKGNGGQPVGVVISSGEMIAKKLEYGYWFIIGFDNENNLRIGSKINEYELRDAVQFKPVLILDGERKVEGSSGWGLQPRSAIGQTADKQVILLTIDGRRPSHSIGATVGDCADIMLKYGAVQAINLDGGSSTAFAYNGETLNIPSTSSGNKDGRYVPNAWVVEGIKIEQGE